MYHRVLKSNRLMVMAVLIVLSACSTTKNDKVNLCGEGYTPVDGICLNQEVANYIGCVRAQGVELNEDKRKTLTAELGYLGAKVSGEGEFSDQLNKKYMASDKVMLEIIKRCDKIAGIHIPKTEVTEKEQSKKEVGNNISGEYRYLGNGKATVEQEGENIKMYLTWAPAGRGPHYEVQGVLKGNTIEGEWYSHYAKRGWFPFYAVVSSSGRNIDFSGTDDPIRSSMNKVNLSKF